MLVLRRLIVPGEMFGFGMIYSSTRDVIGDEHVDDKMLEQLRRPERDGDAAVGVLFVLRLVRRDVVGERHGVDDVLVVVGAGIERVDESLLIERCAGRGGL